MRSVYSSSVTASVQLNLADLWACVCVGGERITFCCCLFTNLVSGAFHMILHSKLELLFWDIFWAAGLKVQLNMLYLLHYARTALRAEQRTSSMARKYKEKALYWDSVLCFSSCLLASVTEKVRSFLWSNANITFKYHTLNS